MEGRHVFENKLLNSPYWFLPNLNLSWNNTWGRGNILNCGNGLKAVLPKVSVSTQHSVVKARLRETNEKSKASSSMWIRESRLGKKLGMLRCAISIDS